MFIPLNFSGSAIPTGHVQPLVEDTGVDGAEVGVVFEVAVGEFVEAGVVAMDAGFDLAADEEDGGGFAVMGPRLPFSLARRPNSEKVRMSTRFPWPRAFRS